MITKLTRTAACDLTSEDYDVLTAFFHPPGQRKPAPRDTPITTDYHREKLRIIAVMLYGDRADADLMFARADAWADAKTKPQ